MQCLVWSLLSHSIKLAVNNLTRLYFSGNGKMPGNELLRDKAHLISLKLDPRFPHLHISLCLSPSHRGDMDSKTSTEEMRKYDVREALCPLKRHIERCLFLTMDAADHGWISCQSAFCIY